MNSTRRVTKKTFRTWFTGMVFYLGTLLASQAAAQVPSITSFAPTSGPAGTSVTITGTNFGAANTVYFGPVAGAITTSSATSITVTVPTGTNYSALTVINRTNNLSAKSDVCFTPTYSCTRTLENTSLFPTDIGISNTITPPYYYLSKGSRPKLADFNGDGKPDIAVAQGAGGNALGYALVFAKNISSPGKMPVFAPMMRKTTAGASADDVEAADLDGDGKLDLVVSNQDSTLSIFRNTSTVDTITFAMFTNLVVPQPALFDRHSLIIRDLDMDGKPDIAVARLKNSQMSVFRNTSSIGNISFAPKLDFPADSSGTLNAGDLDGDGKPDLVFERFVNSTNDSVISVLRNISAVGTIDFAAKVDFYKSPGWNEHNLALGDIDGDGKLDIVASGRTANKLSVLRNTGSAGSLSFATRIDLSLSSWLTGVVLGDMDGDGKVDIIVAESDSYRIAAMKNLSTAGNVNLASPIRAGYTHTVSYYFKALTVGDLDGDGRPDIISDLESDGALHLFRNLNYSPVILSQPTYATICHGSDARFGVVGAGSGIAFQWQENPPSGTGFVDLSNGGIYSGIQSDTLKITLVPESLSGSLYRCVLSGGCGPNDTTSEIARLNVIPPTRLGLLGAKTNMCSGQQAILWANPNEYSSITWYGMEKGTSQFTPITLSGGNYTLSGTRLFVNSLPSLDSSRYFCRVDGTCPPPAVVYSDTTALHYIYPLTITTEPLNKTVNAGDTTSFAVKTSDSVSSYTWERSMGSGFTYFGSPGQGTDSIVVAPSGYQYYRCIVVNTCGNRDTSKICTLFTLPGIITQPVNKTVCENTGTSFNVTAVGTGMALQWQSDAGSGFANLANGGGYGGVTTTTLTIAAVTKVIHGNKFRCIVSGTVNPPDTSNAAVLIVNTHPYLTAGLADTAVEDQLFTYFAAASDSNADSITRFYRSLPSWLTVRNDSLVGTPTEGRRDTSFSVILKDLCNSDTQKVSLTVKAVNDPPAISSQQVDTAIESKQFSYRILVNDPDGPVLRLSALNLPSWLAFAGDSVFGVTPVGAADTSMTIVASDSLLSDTLIVTIRVRPPLTIEEVRASVPTRFDLGRNSPNPFNPSCVIPYAVPFNQQITLDNYLQVRSHSSFVFIGIYDLGGKLIRTLMQGKAGVGYHSVVFDGTDERRQMLGNGIYVFRMTADGFTKTRRMILLK